MIRLIMMLVLSAALLLTAACGGPADNKPHRKALVLYSELDNKFTEDLVRSYNRQNKDGVLLKAIYELKSDGLPPDIVLAEQRTLNGLKVDGELAPVTSIAGDNLDASFKDAENYWYGAFYDPVVFLINQHYAREVGQQAIRGWSDLENTEHIRIAIQNLSNSNSTRNFLGGLATHMGESTSLNYLWNINRCIGQYAKFPFTPVRMVAVGDADLAITRQSYVFKYLENNFPAYVAYPEEGTPVNLYGAAVFKNSQFQNEGAGFISWLITDETVKKVSQVNETGFMFLLPQGLNGAEAEPSKLWFNKDYLLAAPQEALTSKWLDNVRFSNDK